MVSDSGLRGLRNRIVTIDPTRVTTPAVYSEVLPERWRRVRRQRSLAARAAG
jgi:hypothetical protein